MAIIIILLVLLSACSSVPAGRSPGPANDVADKIGDASKPDVYRVGELEILVYKDREAMVRDLPEAPRLVDGLTFGNQRLKIYGYHDRDKKRIYSVDDIPTLLHEFKHYLEPQWEHPAPKFKEFEADGSSAAPSPPDSVEGPARRDSAPPPKLGCLPVCLR